MTEYIKNRLDKNFNKGICKKGATGLFCAGYMKEEDRVINSQLCLEYTACANVTNLDFYLDDKHESCNKIKSWLALKYDLNEKCKFREKVKAGNGTRCSIECPQDVSIIRIWDVYKFIGSMDASSGQVEYKVKSKKHHDIDSNLEFMEIGGFLFLLVLFGIVWFLKKRSRSNYTKFNFKNTLEI